VVAGALDLLDVNAEPELRTRAMQQEVIELEPADEPALARYRVVLAEVVDVAGVPLPQSTRVLAGRELELVPDARRQPAGAQLDARERRPIDHHDSRAAGDQGTRARASRRPAADHRHVVGHGHERPYPATGTATAAICGIKVANSRPLRGSIKVTASL